MIHAGIIVNSLEPEMQFYKGVLGFEEFWRGSRDNKILNWVNMKTPDSTDYIEFMLHDPFRRRRSVARLITSAWWFPILRSRSQFLRNARRQSATRGRSKSARESIVSGN